MVGRTLSIPGTVTDMHPEALVGSVGLERVSYDGDIAVFSGFRLVIEHDCVLECTWSERPYSFTFLKGCGMSFPEFDASVLCSAITLRPEIAMARLSVPALLSEEHRSGYERYLSDRIVPQAEQAVVNGDAGTLEGLFTTGMLGRDILDQLLQRSPRSGKTTMTSVIMSMIRKGS